MKKHYLKKFIGIDRWALLYRTYHHSSKLKITRDINTYTLLLVIIITFTPILCSIFFNPNITTIIFGLVCVISILLRNNLNFPEINSYKGIKLDMMLTHTAFAFGCIPAAFLLLLFPETISEHKEVISHVIKTNRDVSHASASSFLKIFSYIMFASIWVAVIEEVVYRGLLLSAIRRWSLLKDSTYRDIFAVSISAIIFGFAHYQSWGLYASLALIGLGTGFGIAYVCTKEKLLALIIYHFFFDFVSLSIVAFY